MAQLSLKVEIDKEKFQEMIEQFKKENPDFIEVVRCKDCIHHRKFDDWCAILGRFCEDGEWFCACGAKEIDE